VSILIHPVLEARLRADALPMKTNMHSEYNVVLLRGYDPPSPEYETGALPIRRQQQDG
jgi:hypothetical protein